MKGTYGARLSTAERHPFPGGPPVPASRPRLLALAVVLTILNATSALSCTPFASGEDMLRRADESEPPAVEGTTAEPQIARLAPGAAAFGRDWSCLQQEVAPSPDLGVPNREGARWVYSTAVSDIATGQVPGDLIVTVCGAADVECRTPLDTLELREDGWVDIPLNGNFQGYLQFQGEGLIPTLVWFRGLRSGSPSHRFPLNTVALEAIPALSLAAGELQREDAGVMVVRAYDCAGDPAVDVELTHNREGVKWYFSEGLPSVEYSTTGEEGMGGFINVPPGVSQVGATLAGGTAIARNASVLVRPGWLTFLLMDNWSGN